jgi:hypothetical protein
MVLALGGVLIGTSLSAKDKPPVQYQIPIPAPPDFTPLDWLQGTWEGKTVAPSPSGDVKLAVTSDLEKHFLILHGEISLAATETAPATHETWMGIISAEGSNYILRIFSSLGFITRYRISVEGAETHLNPEGGDSPPPGWLFRRVWSRTGTDDLTETVQAAPPGKSFFTYYTAVISRVQRPAKSKTSP